jgi:hypothetical protein
MTVALLAPARSSHPLDLLQFSIVWSGYTCENLLKGELTDDVAKIRCCSLGDELTGIHEVARGKTNLACLYCGVGALASQGTLFKQIQEPLLLSETGEINDGKAVTFLNLWNSSKFSPIPNQRCQHSFSTRDQC